MYTNEIKNAPVTSRILGSGAFFIFGILFLLPGIVRAEHIESFTSDIAIKKDATFTVTENIAYVFTEDRHGIFRCIPTRHQDESSSFFKKRYIDIDVTNVQRDREEEPYTINKNGGEICIKIGDPDATINGPHTYEISYTVGGAISYPPGGSPELYWNVTGNEWEIPMESVEARLTSSDSIFLAERACYQGVSGATDACDEIVEDKGAIRFIAAGLDPSEGLTIAQALDPQLVAHDVRERLNKVWIWGILIIVALIVLGVSYYRYATKFKTGRTIIPEYEPYPGVKPMYTGVLMDTRLDPRDITAGIVYLAEQGFIKIKKIERKVLFLFEVDDYELVLTRPMAEMPSEFEKSIAALIFGENGVVEKKITLHELKTNYADKYKNLLLLQGLKKSLAKDLREQGYFVGFTFSSLFTVTHLIIYGVIGVGLFILGIEFLIVGVVLLVLLLIFFSLGRRTRKGYEALDHLKGFKEFLRVTEKERYAFHNAPQKSPEQFMEYLPYAIAFGVEKEWAKVFEGITIPNPDWYDGGSGMHTFSALSLTNSLGGFSTSFASASGTSASSGGGSSGGGGGGGGGGSW